MKAQKTKPRTVDRTYTRLLQRDSLFATIFIFIIIYFFYFLFELNFKALTIVDNSYKDVDFTDIIYSNASANNATMEQVATKDIVLVNVGNIKRDRVGALLDSINRFGPRIIGIDVFFNHTDSTYYTDSMLKAGLHNSKQLVMASVLPHGSRSNEDKVKRSHPWYGEFNYGYVNFAIEDSFSVVRKYTPYLVKKKDTTFSFAALVVRGVDESAYKKVLRKGKKTEIINYQAGENNFITLEATSILDGEPYIANAIKDHIILVGYISEEKAYPKLRDRFFTPMNASIIGRSHPDAVGLVIHANIILMMLQQNYISHVPGFLVFLLAFLFCYLHIYFYIKIIKKTHLWHHFITKGIQIVSGVGLLVIAMLMYKYWGIKMDIGLIMLSILLSVDLLYFYEAIIKYCNRRFNISTTFVNLK